MKLSLSNETFGTSYMSRSYIAWMEIVDPPLLNLFPDFDNVIYES
jgi:hypothetical protein